MVFYIVLSAKKEKKRYGQKYSINLYKKDSIIKNKRLCENL